MVRLPRPEFSKFNYWRGDYIAVNTYLQEVDWSNILKDCEDVDAAVDAFYTKIREAIIKFIPVTKVKSNSKFPPWFSKELKNMLKEKNKFRIRFKKYKNPMDDISFKLIKKRSNKLSQDNYNAYIIDIENKICSNPKYFWSYVKVKRGGAGNYPSSMTNGEVSSNDGTAICELFATHFKKSYNEISDTGVSNDISN